MKESIGALLKEYIKEPKTTEAAKALGISAGLLSQLLNNKAQLSDKVIDKISSKLAGKDESLKRIKMNELGQIRQSFLNPPLTNGPLKGFEKFFETASNTKRLICITYRDIPQSTNAGKYPGLIDTGVVAIRNGLSCAMFQSFGPVEEIKKKVLEALESSDVEESEKWNYIYRLVRDIHEVYERLKTGLENGEEECRGQLVLYEAKELDPFTTCDVNSRIFYSQELSGGQNTVRVAQLVAGIDDIYYIECDLIAVNQFAVAAQFYPIPRYWRENNNKLPDTESKLEEAYKSSTEKRRWSLYKRVSQ